MSRVAYVNGRYVPHGEASVHIEDRGYRNADGAYEVIDVAGGVPVDEEAHLDRLDRSLGELRIARPMTRRAMKLVMRQVLARNLVKTDGMIHIQVTRGGAPRGHGFPESAPPSIVMTARPLKRLPAELPDDAGVAEGGILPKGPNIREPHP